MKKTITEVLELAKIHEHTITPGTYNLSELRLTGNVREFEKKELIPNLVNIGLMDVAKIIYYEAEYTEKQPHHKTRLVWYYIPRADIIERVEIGSYYNQD